MRNQVRLNTLLKPLALAAFAGYCYWQICWLIRGKLAPSIFSYYTGFPNPGSGVSRSVKALLAGEYLDFVLYNPFTIPIFAMFIFSFYRLGNGWLKNRTLTLPASLGWLWLGLLLCAWIAKFMIGKEYW